MRNIKIQVIKNIKTHDQKTAITKYKKQADSKRIDASLELTLLDEVRNGNRSVIPKLVDSLEHVLISIIERHIDNESVSIEKMFDVGRGALTILAESELGSTFRESFFRFGGFWVEQAIIKELSKQ